MPSFLYKALWTILLYMADQTSILMMMTICVTQQAQNVSGATPATESAAGSSAHASPQPQRVIPLAEGSHVLRPHNRATSTATAQTTTANANGAATAPQPSACPAPDLQAGLAALHAENRALRAAAAAQRAQRAAAAVKASAAPADTMLVASLERRLAALQAQVWLLPSWL